MTAAEHLATTIVDRPLPRIQSLMFPPDGCVIEGRSVVFRWDFSHAPGRPTHFRLIVKRQLVDEAAADAIAGSEIAFETLVEHVQFFVMNIAQLRSPSATYVWQVTTLTSNGTDGLIDIVASDVRTFSLPSGQGEIGKFITGVSHDEGEPAQTAPVETMDSAREGAGRVSLACPNGDLETGTLTGWQGRYGSRISSPTIYLNSLSIGIVSGRHTIRSVADGVDPVLAPYGVNLPQVGEGSYSLRLGNSNVNGDADLISYTFTVNAQNKNFTFRYAVVLENPSDHAANEQPFFGWYILRGPSIFYSFSPPWAYNHLVTMGIAVADSSNPFFKSAGDNIVYRGWTPTCVDLSMYLGQTMTIVFYTADCSMGGHFGYAYIDGLCQSNEAIPSFTMPSEICASATLSADGSASSNETSFFWSIEESDANWGRNPATEVYEWFVAQQAGPIDLTAFYASWGGHFKCNTYYRIKLAVSNNCTPWNETAQLLHVTCPVVTAGPDLCVSCVPNGQTTQLGVGNPSGVTYVWSPATGLDNPSSPSPLHAQGSVPYPITYTVTATDAKGCSNSDQVTLYCEAPTVAISELIECCKVTLNADVVGASTIQWSTGQSGVTSIEVTSPGSYSVTGTNPCGSVTASVVVSALDLLSGDFNAVSFNNGFTPGSGSAYTTPKDKLYIADVTVGNPPGIIGVPNSYNATDYKLEIFDRWGNLFKTITDQNCGGFPNWSIAWDGTNNQGNLVQSDVYVWKLSFKNCQYQEWRPATIRRHVTPQCIRWRKFLGIRIKCLEYDHPTGIVDNPNGIDNVTVFY
jgi:hypothetical protein